VRYGYQSDVSSYYYIACSIHETKGCLRGVVVSYPAMHGVSNVIRWNVNTQFRVSGKSATSFVSNYAFVLLPCSVSATAASGPLILK
jgi:hypothetical protein